MAHIPESLKSFLSDSSAIFVGAGVDRDVTNLRNDYGLIVSNVVDLQPLAMTLKDSPFFGSKLPGLQNMAWVFVGLRMEKPSDVTMSNWEDKELSREQIKYACIDAYASYKIGYKLLVGSEGGVGLGWRLLKLMVYCVGLGWRLRKLMVYLVGIWIALDWFF
ncbi:3'-5' exonuclease-like [Magnolia sinica]|uniref:3'-5' exonuclease-like n=1 Tax=Magnolia sinica TaxID=86752 RepID=UPI002657C73D|nr:3'-5' exonuclease-like [Magnolia sinica]